MSNAYLYFNCAVPRKFELSLTYLKTNTWVSLTDNQIRLIIDAVIKRKSKVERVAERYDLTKSRIYQLLDEYKKTGCYPRAKKRGPKATNVSESVRKQVISAKMHKELGSAGVAKYLRIKRGLHIGNMKVHDILLEEGLTEKDPQKSNRRKPWVRYEREHSLSAVHMDWYVCEDGITNVCVVLDDASRMVLAAGEFPAQTAEYSIQLLKEAYEKFQHICPIREVITDHGTQFYANTRDSFGEADHSFEQFCEEYGIHHILARVKHPQTNGKMERWFQTYGKFRKKHATIQEFVDWYNKERPHQSLDTDIMETPEMAFYRKAVDIIRENCIAMITRILEET